MPEPSLHALRVLLLTGDPSDLELVTAALSGVSHGATVMRVDSLAGFTGALAAFQPDVVLCDGEGGAIDSLQALRLTQRWRPECPLLLLATAFSRTAMECLKAGAEGIVSKADLSRLGHEIAEAVTVRVPLRRLSWRQREVMQLLAAGCSTRTIAERLCVSVKTVETHRAQLMQRLGLRELASLVRYAVRVRIVSPECGASPLGRDLCP